MWELARIHLPHSCCFVLCVCGCGFCVCVCVFGLFVCFFAGRHGALRLSVPRDLVADDDTPPRVQGVRPVARPAAARA